MKISSGGTPPVIAPSQSPAPGVAPTEAGAEPRLPVQQPNVEAPSADLSDGAFREELDEIVDKMNETVQAYNYNLKFEVVDKKRIVITVIDTNTGEIIKQIPPKDLISAFKRMDGFFGLMVDRKV